MIFEKDDIVLKLDGGIQDCSMKIIHQIRIN